MKCKFTHTWTYSGNPDYFPYEGMLCDCGEVKFRSMRGDKPDGMVGTSGLAMPPEAITDEPSRPTPKTRDEINNALLESEIVKVTRTQTAQEILDMLEEKDLPQPDENKLEDFSMIISYNQAIKDIKQLITNKFIKEE